MGKRGKREKATLDFGRARILALIELDSMDSGDGTADKLDSSFESAVFELGHVRFQTQCSSECSSSKDRIERAGALLFEVPSSVGLTLLFFPCTSLSLDSEYFAPLPNSPNQKPNDREVEKWRERVIPTFNR